MSEAVVLIHAGGAVDGFGLSTGPCSVLVQTSPGRFPALTLLAIGPREEVLAHPAAGGGSVTRVCDDPQSVLIPGLVNSHTHLDLTHMGPREYGENQTFVEWIDLVRRSRYTDPEQIRASVRAGVELSLRGGVVAVGDIAGASEIAALEALLGGPLRGLAGIEVFGLGRRQSGMIDRLDALAEQADAVVARAEGEPNRFAWTWQAHAPYSAGLDLYRACALRSRAKGAPLLTHLGETPEERAFVESGVGPQVDFLKALGIWDESTLGDVGQGRSPVEHLESVLRQCPAIAAHLNDVSDRDIEILRETGATVAYCPRASAYFRQERVFGPHRYRDMLASGVRVALGTDSIVNLPIAQADRLSTLDEARYLVQRDDLDPVTALAMASWHGGEALGLERSGFSLSGHGLPRELYGLSLVTGAEPDSRANPLLKVMHSEHPPRLIGLTG